MSFLPSLPTFLLIDDMSKAKPETPALTREVATLRKEVAKPKREVTTLRKEVAEPKPDASEMSASGEHLWKAVELNAARREAEEKLKRFFINHLGNNPNGPTKDDLFAIIRELWVKTGVLTITEVDEDNVLIFEEGRGNPVLSSQSMMGSSSQQGSSSQSARLFAMAKEEVRKEQAQVQEEALEKAHAKNQAGREAYAESYMARTGKNPPCPKLIAGNECKGEEDCMKFDHGMRRCKDPSHARKAPSTCSLWHKVRPQRARGAHGEARGGCVNVQGGKGD
jgi:hypothetical protein